MNPSVGQSNGPLPPLHPPRESPLPPDNPDTWIWPLIILSGSLAIWILWRLWRRCRMPPDQDLGRLPATEAWTALSQLSGCAEDPAVLSRIALVLRRFLEQTARLKPAVRTTEELIAALRTSNSLSPERLQSVAQILLECDHRRYAAIPSDTALSPLLPQAIAWVEAHIPLKPDSIAIPPAAAGPPAP